MQKKFRNLQNSLQSAHEAKYFFDINYKYYGWNTLFQNLRWLKLKIVDFKVRRQETQNINFQTKKSVKQIDNNKSIQKDVMMVEIGVDWHRLQTAIRTHFIGYTGVSLGVNWCPITRWCLLWETWTYLLELLLKRVKPDFHILGCLCTFYSLEQRCIDQGIEWSLNMQKLL